MKKVSGYIIDQAGVMQYSCISCLWRCHVISCHIFRIPSVTGHVYNATLSLSASCVKDGDSTIQLQNVGGHHAI